jgi:DNA-directed RNA polymerase subunit RPC12/RpoP
VGRSEENRGFTCVVCQTHVKPLTNGSYRNHCPHCLSSLHVDEIPGDRLATCRGVMDAVALRRNRKGMQIVHRCRRCGRMSPNKVADRGDQPDDVDALIHLMHR